MSEKHPLSILNDWAQANRKKVKFEETRVGMKFERRFVATMTIEGLVESFKGAGLNKKSARSDAARQAIAVLKLQG